METPKAFLIIDMQKGSFTEATPRFDSVETIKRINTIAEAFRRNGFPVIFIQHDGSTRGDFIPYTVEWELVDDLIVKPSDILIDKYANDVFYKSNLQVKLIELQIDELVIAGCATDFCVESTVQSALSKDYTITVIADGHTTGDRPHLKADDVIRHYNWVWQNMIPTQGKIHVKTCQAIMDEMMQSDLLVD